MTGSTVRLIATVTGVSNPRLTTLENRVRTRSRGVNWAIDNQNPGDTTSGSISSTGLYTAPSVVPYPNVVVVRATSRDMPSLSALVSLTITTPAEDWPKFRRDLWNSGVSGESGISSSNVDQLKLKWKFNAGTGFLASPAVATVNGTRMVFIGHANGVMFAVNADTGEQIWSYTVDQVGPCAYYSLGCLIGSSAAVDNGTVYFGAGNGFVYALDAARGALVWKTQLGDGNLGYAAWTSPAVYKGLVYVGVASQYDAPCVPGNLQALDANTGAPAWKFDTLDQTTCPSGANCVGAPVWSSPALDVRFGTVWVGTGNPGASCTPPTANATKYPDGLLAVDLATGTFKSYYQAVANDTVDADFGAAPVLHETGNVNECTGIDDRQYWVSVDGKDGWAYLGQRGAGGLLQDPREFDFDPSEYIGSPLAVPWFQSRACGASSGNTINMGNYVFLPAEAGPLNVVQQVSNGGLKQLPRIRVAACPAGDSCLNFSSPVAISDLVFFGGGDNNLHAATISGGLAGKVVWTFATGGTISSSAAISHGAIYFGSDDGYLYCLSINGQ
jgi:polyvinyl alcohol dehydrogenase (cytochrome)